MSKITGFENEDLIIGALNGNFSTLHPQMQRILLEIDPNLTAEDMIACKKKAGMNKADINIKINKDKYTVSVKKGSGNSVHQEPVEGFISYLERNFEITSEVMNSLRHFIWGDNTLDGSGPIDLRVSAAQYKKRYPDNVQLIQHYFNIHKESLLRRFLIQGGENSSQSADFIYYGEKFFGTIVSATNILNYARNVSKGPLSIGVLTFQAWNRNINGGKPSEKKRGQIQLKWGTLREDIKQCYEQCN
jgi:hypothetical protein